MITADPTPTNKPLFQWKERETKSITFWNIPSAFVPFCQLLSFAYKVMIACHCLCHHGISLRVPWTLYLFLHQKTKRFVCVCFKKEHPKMSSAVARMELSADLVKLSSYKRCKTYVKTKLIEKSASCYHISWKTRSSKLFITVIKGELKTDSMYKQILKEDWAESTGIWALHSSLLTTTFLVLQTQAAIKRMRLDRPCRSGVQLHGSGLIYSSQRDRFKPLCFLGPVVYWYLLLYINVF